MGAQETEAATKEQKTEEEQVSWLSQGFVMADMQIIMPDMLDSPHYLPEKSLWGMQQRPQLDSNAIPSCGVPNLEQHSSFARTTLQEKDSKAKEPKKDPLEEYCEDNPETDECR